MQVEEIRQALQGRNRSKVARDLGMAYTTIHSLARGESIDHKLSTLQKVSDYLEATNNEGEIKGKAL